ncbi:hypothetical protein DOE56_08235 [Salmonella enterica subsp. arizonae serovar 63:g,z51:-]|nr:hypothetical protein DOE56_08235 [Salmonella enterica subsp. arizonae serovar 63:g,z51:-]
MAVVLKTGGTTIGLANNNIIPAEDLDRSYIVYPQINQEKCVSCLLCGHVCPVACIDLGEVRFKKGEKEHALTL